MVKSIFDSDYGKEIEVVDQEDEEEEEQKKVTVRSIFDPPEEAKPPVLDLEATETPRVDVDYEEETPIIFSNSEEISIKELVEAVVEAPSAIRPKA